MSTYHLFEIFKSDHLKILVCIETCPLNFRLVSDHLWLNIELNDALNEATRYTCTANHICGLKRFCSLKAQVKTAQIESANRKRKNAFSHTLYFPTLLFTAGASHYGTPFGYMFFSLSSKLYLSLFKRKGLFQKLTILSLLF
jgi:hypothetical protein